MPTHFLVMSPCSHDFLLVSLYVYSNIHNFNCIVDYDYSSLTYECQVLDSELSTCLDVLVAIH